MEILDLIKTRRSVRRYKPEPVAKNVLEKVVEAALWAPSYMDWQNWHYIILGGEKKKELFGFLEDSFRKITECLDDDISEGVRKRTDFFLDIAGEAPNIIAVFSDVDLTTSPEALFSVAASVENLLLAAHAEGLGACWVSSAIYVAEDISDFLGVGDKELAGIITIGYPEESPEHSRRKPGRVKWEGVDG